MPKNNAKLVGLEWVWGLLQPGFVRWAPPASQNHFNHWSGGLILLQGSNRSRGAEPPLPPHSNHWLKETYIKICRQT